MFLVSGPLQNKKYYSLYLCLKIADLHRLALHLLVVKLRVEPRPDHGHQIVEVLERLLASI